MTENKDLAMDVANDMMAYLGGKEIDDGVDAEESVSVPVLRVVQKSSEGIETNDGQDAAVGSLFYKPTLQDYKSVKVNILHVKQCKLRSKVYGTDTDEYEDKAHYLVTGVIQETNELFVTYVKGMAYSSVWDLLEITRPYRKHASTPVPMYALTIELYTEKETSDKGFSSNVLKYKLIKNKAGQPNLVQLDRFQWLEGQLSNAKKMIQGIIDINHKYESDVENENIIIADEPREEPKVVPVETNEFETDTEDVSDDVPF